MTPLGEIYLTSALKNRGTANYCRRNAIENEASKCSDLARKWWSYYWDYRDKAWSNLQAAKKERIVS